MRPDISEFSYGYALTEELATAHSSYITASPVFPSLIAEGKKGAGWDLQLELTGIPAFLQFKVGHPVFRRNAVEFKQNKFPIPPYGSATPLHYRMHLRAPRHSHQHSSLRALETDGHFVRYVAPAFHDPDSLNEAYLNNEIAERSFWLSPLQATLPDDGEHHVAYVTSAGPYCICSPEPDLLEVDGTFSRFISDIRERIEVRRVTGVEFNAMFQRLGDDLTAIVEDNSTGRPATRSAKRNQRSFSFDTQLPTSGSRSVDRTRRTLARARDELPPASRAAYLARTYFDAELIVIGSPLALGSVLDQPSDHPQPE